MRKIYKVIRNNSYNLKTDFGMAFTSYEKAVCFILEDSKDISVITSYNENPWNRNFKYKNDFSEQEWYQLLLNRKIKNKNFCPSKGSDYYKIEIINLF